MIEGIKNITRLTRIYRVFAKHDALFFAEDTKAFPVISAVAKILAPMKSSRSKGLREGQRLANAFCELGPTFIKLGQALSVRSDLVGEQIAEDLSNLQDNLPPFDTERAIKIIEKELGNNLEQLFPEFDRTPVAAASIAQVHFATCKDGSQVAVKVRRPNIKKLFMKDIDLFFWIAKHVEEKLPKYRRLKLREVVKTFSQTCQIEMDFTYEAAAASELAENFEGDGDIRVPKVYWERCSERVLTIERFYGTQIDDLAALNKANLSPDDILKKSANIFMKQALRDGFFHADMHPGNVLVDENGRICVFDFGIMGRLDRKTKIFLAEMLSGFLNGDYKKVADIHFEAGYIPKDQSRDLFAQACRAIGEPILDLPQNEISIARLLQQLFRVTEQFQMETQPQLLLLQKTMMMAEGIARTLNPNINFWELSRELIEDWGKHNLGPKAKLEDRAKDALETFNNIVTAASHLENMITEHGLKIHPDTVRALRGKSERKYGGFWQGFVFASIILSAVYYILSN